jgi:SagB-type dehydrogenase family enzyme
MINSRKPSDGIPRKFIVSAVVVSFLILMFMIFTQPARGENMSEEPRTDTIKLPDPQYNSKISVESAILARRSIRNYRLEPLDLSDISQLLWAAQGITDPGGYRAAPSAGALYPLEIYALVGNATHLSAGIYKYRPARHELQKKGSEDRRDALCQAALSQDPIRKAPVVLVICGVYERTTSKYGERGIRYVYMEAGHAAQNALLQAVSLNLGAVVIGAFRDETVAQVVGCEKGESPLYIIPVGK